MSFLHINVCFRHTTRTGNKNWELGCQDEPNTGGRFIYRAVMRNERGYYSMESVSLIQLVASRTLIPTLLVILKHGHSYIRELEYEVKTDSRTVYSTLRKLTDLGLVERVGKRQVQNPRSFNVRHYYVLTSYGRKIADALKICENHIARTNVGDKLK